VAPQCSIIVCRVTAVELPLIRRQGFIDGSWVDADSGATFSVTNPATGDVVAEVPRMGAAETRRALAAAERALPAWKQRTAKDRARILRRLADLMLEHEDDLARLMVVEQGKPLAEARVEVAYAASFYEWFGEEAKRVYGDTIPTPWPDKRIHVTKEPVGVTAGITPWNFPAAMPTRKSAPALAAGCTMVLKPAHAKLAGYFNVDNGTGAIRGVYLQGNEAMAPLFEAWMKPFHNLGMRTLTIRDTGGTDHLAFLKLRLRDGRTKADVPQRRCLSSIRMAVAPEVEEAALRDPLCLGRNGREAMSPVDR